MRIEVDWDRCNGLGMCEAEAPEFFEIDDDGDLQVLREFGEESERAELEAAVESCPTAALRIVESGIVESGIVENGIVESD